MFGPSVQLEERRAGSKPVRGQAVTGRQLRPTERRGAAAGGGAPGQLGQEIRGEAGPGIRSERRAHPEGQNRGVARSRKRGLFERKKESASYVRAGSHGKGTGSDNTVLSFCGR